MTTYIGSNDAFGNSVAVDNSGKYSGCRVFLQFRSQPYPGIYNRPVYQRWRPGYIVWHGQQWRIYSGSWWWFNGYCQSSSHTACRSKNSCCRFIVRRIILAFTVIRLIADGSSLDSTFNAGSGTPGIVATHIDGGESNPYAMALQSDGKIVVAGYAESAGVYKFAVARFTAAGVLDTATFNPLGSTPGAVSTRVGDGSEQAFAVAIQPGDQKIVAAGYAHVGTIYDFALVRYNTSGTIDTSFSADGIVTTQVGTSADSEAYGVALQGDGKIVAAGYTTGATTSFAVVRYGF